MPAQPSQSRSTEELEALFLYAVSGLSWAVGHLEGLGQPKDNYAARVLERLERPRVIMQSQAQERP